MGQSWLVYLLPSGRRQAVWEVNSLLSGSKTQQMSDRHKVSIVYTHVLHISTRRLWSDSEGTATSIFFPLLDIFQLSHANELPNKLNEFSRFKFLRGFISTSLLVQQRMNPGWNTRLAAACFMKYLFPTDARSPVGTAVLPNSNPSLLLHYNWDTSRGDIYLRLCVYLQPSVITCTDCVRLDSYPSMGCRAMARGFSMFCHSSTLRCVPSRLATSMRDVPESVQYNLSWIQSMASPPDGEKNTVSNLFQYELII